MGIDSNDKLGKNHLMRVQAALNGEDNAIFGFVQERLGVARKELEASNRAGNFNKSELELEVAARQKVIEQIGNPKILESAKPVGQTKAEGITRIFDFISDPFTAFFKHFGEQALATFTEKFINKSDENILAVWERTGKETSIRQFAEKNNINPDWMVADTKKLSEKTVELASITPEQQAAKILAADKVRVAEAEQKAKSAAEEAERKAVAAAEEAFNRQLKLAAELKKVESGQQQTEPAGSKTEEKKGNTGKKDAKGAKGTKTSTITDAKGGLNGIASEVAHADRGSNQTPPTNAAIIGGTASKSM